MALHFSTKRAAASKKAQGISVPDRKASVCRAVAAPVSLGELCFSELREAWHLSSVTTHEEFIWA